MELVRLLEHHPILLAAGEVTIGAGAIALLYKAVEVMAKFALKYFFVGKRINDEFTATVIISFLNRHAASFGINDEHYGSARQYVKPEEDDMIVFFRKLSQSFRLFLYHGRPILLFPGEKSENDIAITTASFRFLRWTINWDQLLEKASRDYDDFLEKREVGTKKRFRVVKHTGNGQEGEGKAPEMEWGEQEPINWRVEDIGPPSPEDPLNHLSLGAVCQSLVRDVKFWHTHRDWYRQRGLAWRRGYLLFGRPGTGKTSMVRAIAEELDIPIHVFDLASMDNQEFTESWKQTQQDNPRIVLFEDFDAIFEGRKNKIEESFLSYDCVLNAIDGVERQDGLLLFVTTNHVGSIDPALGVPDEEGRSTRPGRIDVAMELPGLDYAGRLKMARRILQDDLEAEKMALGCGDDETAAQFQERCMRRALAELWGQAA